MSQQSTAEIELDEPDERVTPSRRKAAKRPVRDDQEDVDGDGDGVRLDPEEVREQIMTQLSVPPEVAGAALLLRRNASYKACKNGDIESFKVGGRIVVPTAPLRRRLGLEPAQPATPVSSAKPIDPPKRRRK